MRAVQLRIVEGRGAGVVDTAIHCVSSCVSRIAYGELATSSFACSRVDVSEGAVTRHQIAVVVALAATVVTSSRASMRTVQHGVANSSSGMVDSAFHGIATRRGSSNTRVISAGLEAISTGGELRVSSASHCVVAHSHNLVAVGLAFCARARSAYSAVRSCQLALDSVVVQRVRDERHARARLDVDRQSLSP